MQHDFGKTPSVDKPRSVFDLSHGHKTAIDFDYIYPICVLDVLPGDSIKVRSSLLARLSTPQFPTFDNIHIDEHWLSIPWRLIWENARKFHGEQDNPSDSIDYTIPQFTSFTPTEDSLHDYLGLPINGNAMTPNSIYHRAYAKCINDWYRDQNLQNSVVCDTDDGPDNPADYTLFKRGKRFDYFTQALISPQKGDAVNLPLGSSAPITGLGKVNQNYVAGSVNVYETDGTGTTNYPTSSQGINGTTADGSYVIEEDPNNSGFPNVRADLTNAVAANINDFREALAIQSLLEADQRGGTRYPDITKNLFGVQFYEPHVRPEILAINSKPLAITPVQTNSSVATGENTGDLGAFGVMGSTDGGFTKSFYEHSIVLCLISARADQSYSQGMPLRYTKQTRYDYYLPPLMGLGERAILNGEIYYQGNATDDAVFGYIPHWDEYRSELSRISGAMRSSHSLSLDSWHLSEEFLSLPVLGSTFIQSNTPIDRALYSVVEPDLILDTYFDIKSARCLPSYGIPGMGVRL